MNMGDPTNRVALSWNRLIERYRGELEEYEDYEEVVSAESLREHIESIKTLAGRRRATIVILNRLATILNIIDTFSTAAARSAGANAKTANNLLWGSIRLILTRACSHVDSLRDVVQMLEEVILTLPNVQRFVQYPLVNGICAMNLLEIYSEIARFHIRTINVFRPYLQRYLQHDALSESRDDFDQTVRRITLLSTTIELELDRARGESNGDTYSKARDLPLGLKERTDTEQSAIQPIQNIKYYNFPRRLPGTFWGRQDSLKAISNVLEDQTSDDSLKTFALFGMGGVGKTKIALRYARDDRQRYNAIYWVSAETEESLKESFQQIARLLGLSNDDEVEQDIDVTIPKIRAFLERSHGPWLMIFDNADKMYGMGEVWPVNAKGSILITSRDPETARNLATSGFHVKPFDDELGSQALLHLVGLDKDSASNVEKATAISQAFGGLPLAITQVGNFISRRRLPLHRFLPLYESNPTKIKEWENSLGDYDLNLTQVWESSFRILGEDECPTRLLYILAFLEPDAIDETIFYQGAEYLSDEELYYMLKDELSLCDAEEDLIRTSLIEKDRETGTLSLHRLVQSAVLEKYPSYDKERYFDATVELLTGGFPEHWGEDQGHQFEAWSKCETCLPHVKNLVKRLANYSGIPGDAQPYGELVLRCGWYLYERETYDEARMLVDAALTALPDQTSLPYASAADLSGLIHLDLANPKKALALFEQALRIRKEQLPENDPFIAYSLNNIALAHTEISNLSDAYSAHEKAIAIRLSLNSDRIGNSYSNMSSLLLRMGKPDEAEEMLKRCPSLKNFTDDTFLNTGNPRFSGDMVLLARIRRAQGRVEEALRLATKALAFRKKLLGNRFKTCDSLYDVASLLYQMDKSSSAIDLLRELVTISSSLPLGEGQLARANYKLSVIYSHLGKDEQSEEFKVRAMDAKAQFRLDAANDAFEEAAFAELCPWMLW